MENGNAFSKQQQEFTAMVVRNLPWLESHQMQYFITSPHFLRHVLYELPLKFWKGAWDSYYKFVWGIENIKWNEVVIPQYEDGYSQFVLVLEQMHETMVYQRMVEDNYIHHGDPFDPGNLDLQRYFLLKHRVPNDYAVWVKPEHVYVPVKKSETVQEISEKYGSMTMNLLEKLIWEHFVHTMSSMKIYRNEDAVTLCPANLSLGNEFIAGFRAQADIKNPGWLYYATHEYIEKLAVKKVVQSICYDV